MKVFNPILWATVLTEEWPGWGTKITMLLHSVAIFVALLYPGFLYETINFGTYADGLQYLLE